MFMTVSTNCKHVITNVDISIILCYYKLDSVLCNVYYLIIVYIPSYTYVCKLMFLLILDK